MIEVTGYAAEISQRVVTCEWCGCVLAIEREGQYLIEPGMDHAGDCPERPGAAGGGMEVVSPESPDSRISGN
jgi:hypothetical protein